MGNFNRLIGDSHNAIECFRKALNLDPRNSVILINLARLLLKLKYYDDAIYLTKRSIEFSNKSRSTWFQHFTLAEIYNTLGEGYDNQALSHVLLALKLRPANAKATKLATELGSKSFIQSSRFVYMFRIFENIFFMLTSTAPSFYLQLFFHMFILVFLILLGIVYSLMNLIFDVRLCSTTCFTSISSIEISTDHEIIENSSVNSAPLINHQVKSATKKVIPQVNMRVKKPPMLNGCKYFRY